MNLISKKKEFLRLTQADTLVVKNFDSFLPSEYVSFPLGELSSLGTLFSSLPKAFSTVEKGKTLYEATFPVAGNLAKAKDGSGLLGTIINDKGIAGQARFHEVKTIASVADPTLMFMALTLMTINKSLSDISETQKEIFSFLELDKETKLKGNLIILSEIIEDYQHNWNNNQYRTNREMQVLDIKREAEQNILFYRETIERKFNKKSLIHLDTAKFLNEIQSKFKYCKLSLYLYAFSSFLDILLLENFDSVYLSSVTEKIKMYSSEYDEFFSKTLQNIENYAASSLQSRALQGLSIAGKFAGEQISKIPDKDNRIKIDDKLLSSSTKLENINSQSIEKTLKSFTSVEDSGIELFIEKIGFINKTYNEPIRIVFDNQNLHLAI